MASNVNLPKLGTNMTEAIILQWLKQEGDQVAVGEPIVEVETEKANFEVEAEASGFLRQILAQPGDTVPVAMPLGVIAGENEDISQHLADVTKQREQRAAEESHVAGAYNQWRNSSPSEPPKSEVSEVIVADPIKSNGRPLASPAARRLAREMSVDLRQLAQSIGTGKMIQEADVRILAQGVPIAIFGAGLGASQVMDVLRFLPEFRLVALIDEDDSLWNTELQGYPVYGVERLSDAVHKGEIQAVAVSLHSEHRRKVARRLKEACPGLSFPALVHPNAYIGQGVVVEDGVLVEAGAVVGNSTVLREGVIVDVGVVISHHCDVGAFTHLAPRCTLSGAVNIKEHAVIMAGAVIANTATIGRNVMVTPGSVVASDNIPDDVIVQGNPARVIGKSKRGQ